MLRCCFNNQDNQRQETLHSQMMRKGRWGDLGDGGLPFRSENLEITPPPLKKCNYFPPKSKANIFFSSRVRNDIFFINPAKCRYLFVAKLFTSKFISAYILLFYFTFYFVIPVFILFPQHFVHFIFSLFNPSSQWRYPLPREEYILENIHMVYPRQKKGTLTARHDQDYKSFNKS